MSSGIPPGSRGGDDSRALITVPACWQRLKVLVVDDHPAYCLLMSGTLDRLGLDHQACRDGRAALAALDVQHFDLILTDCQMPLMDGYAMTREIRRREREALSTRLPIIGLTSNLGPDEVRLCMEAGMDAWLIKPLTFLQLHHVLVYWLDQAHVGAFEQGTKAQALVGQKGWPTRTTLVQMFGRSEVVDSMLGSLIHEARQDLRALSGAVMRLDGAETVQHLHRLIGSVAFLGVTSLEKRGLQLMTRVSGDGVATHARDLIRLRQDLVRYLAYLSAL